MSKKLSLDSLTKKLKNVANTQDSIPMFSFWIIQHKANHKLIVDTWLEILKNSSPNHRLTLLYLANDVIQWSKRKGAEVFKEYFASILPEAISFLRDPVISSGVTKVLNVWMSRNVYGTELVDQLHAALLTNGPPDTLKQKLLAEYKPNTLIDAITTLKKNEDALVIEEKQLRNIHVDASSSDNIHKLRDKVDGERFSRNFEESATNIERFIVKYEKFVEERKALTDGLSQGAVFYKAQYHEAKIVVNAYQSFDARVSKVKKLLDQIKLKFSPKTPPPYPADYSKLADMDMADSDQELGNKSSKILSVDTYTNRPTKSANAVTSTTTKALQPTQQMGSFVSRPGMRGASTSLIFSTTSPLKTPSANINIPATFNGSTSTGFGSKVSTPSASPPSPEGSPELNISSPPRYPSLESRLADIFSTGSTHNMGSTTENTGNESDTDSISNAPQGKQSTASDSAPETLERKKIDVVVTSVSADDTAASWQNTIPVIGGNRLSTPAQKRLFLENMVALDGGSTPLQDEMSSEGEHFHNRKGPSNGLKSEDHVLPPPSFSGDALNFLTKFMGPRTNTSLAQPPTSQEPVKSANPLDNLKIDWNSIQSITDSVGSWQQPLNTSGYNPTITQQPMSRKQDTDYRNTTTTVISFPPLSAVTSVQAAASLSVNDDADQFRHILRRRSSEHPPYFALSTEEVIVEEEEILVEDDVLVDQRPQLQRCSARNNQVHLNNLKNIPTTFGENLSPPPAHPPNNLLQLAGQKRPPQDQDFRLRGDFYPPRFERMLMEPIHREHPFSTRPRMSERPRTPINHYRLPFRGSFRARAPHQGDSFRCAAPIARGNSAAEFAVGENEYYDLLYDELRPKFPRLNMGRGQFRPRRPFR